MHYPMTRCCCDRLIRDQSPDAGSNLWDTGEKRESRPPMMRCWNALFRLVSVIRRVTMFTRHQYDRVVDLVVEPVAGWLVIAWNFNTERDFRHRSLRLLERRDHNKLLLECNSQDEAKDSNDEQDQKKIKSAT